MATKRRQIAGDVIAGDVPISQSKVQRQALVALLLVFLPNLVLTGVGLLMRGQAQQVAEAQAAGHFGLARFLRQVGLNAFLLLPMGAWLWRRQDGWRACGWQRERLWRAMGLGVLLGAATLLLRARPFAPEQLVLADTWWALATYAVVALAEETLFRGFLQGWLAAWLGRWWGWLATALLFTTVSPLSPPMGGIKGGRRGCWAGSHWLRR